MKSVGIGVAICDESDQLVLKISKSLLSVVNLGTLCRLNP